MKGASVGSIDWLKQQEAEQERKEAERAEALKALTADARDPGVKDRDTVQSPKQGDARAALADALSPSNRFHQAAMAESVASHAAAQGAKELALQPGEVAVAQGKAPVAAAEEAAAEALRAPEHVISCHKCKGTGKVVTEERQEGQEYWTKVERPCDQQGAHFLGSITVHADPRMMQVPVNLWQAMQAELAAVHSDLGDASQAANDLLLENAEMRKKIDRLDASVTRLKGTIGIMRAHLNR